ncbi:ribonuclease H-like domain-containing protein [Mycena polygramma]|nr:ribonuclease H-like domain-containing protein [Mycena polygramma]
MSQDVPTYPILPAFPQVTAVRYVTDVFTANALLAEVLDEGVTEIGFDAEMVPRLVSAEELKAVTDSDRKAAVARLIFQRSNAATFHPDWAGMGLCILQVTVGHTVLTSHTATGIPLNLKKILSDPDIKKLGVNVSIEGKTLWEDLRLDVMSLVDVGLIAKLIKTMDYAEMGYVELSLQGCVRDFLGMQLDKEHQSDQGWDKGLDGAMQQYAAKDAKAALDVYQVMKRGLVQKEGEIGHKIPECWYTSHYINGAHVRTEQSFRLEWLPWKSSICPWFSEGKFQNYFE